MSYKYSASSLEKLKTCHPDIQKIFNVAIEFFDITIIEGARTSEQQAEYKRTGKSQTLNSLHLKQEDGYSHAIDATLYPINWNDKERFIMFAGYILGLADCLYQKGEITHRLVSGIDWDKDFYIKEHNFFDGPHFQLGKGK